MHTTHRNLEFKLYRKNKANASVNKSTLHPHALRKEAMPQEAMPQTSNNTLSYRPTLSVDEIAMLSNNRKKGMLYEEILKTILSNDSFGRQTFVSQNRFSLEADCSIATVYRGTREMEAADLLTVKRQCMDSNVYELGPELSTKAGLIKWAKVFPFLLGCLLMITSQSPAQYKAIQRGKDAILFNINMELLDIRKLRELACGFGNVYIISVYLRKLERLKARGWWGNAMPELRLPESKNWAVGLNEAQFHGYNRVN